MKLMKIIFLVMPLSLLCAGGLESFATATGYPQSNCTPNCAPIACNLAAMTADQRKRHAELRAQVHKAVAGTEELADGYAFKFAPDSKTVVSLAEFISLERLCCPFFKFELVVEGGNSPMWLRMTGREGVKTFMQAELGINF